MAKKIESKFIKVFKKSYFMNITKIVNTETKSDIHELFKCLYRQGQLPLASSAVFVLVCEKRESDSQNNFNITKAASLIHYPSSVLHSLLTRWIHE